MAGAVAGAIVFAGFAVLGQTGEPVERQNLTVTVHVEDYARIDAQEWARVRQLVAEIFGAVGVPLSWAGALRVPKQDWPRDGLCLVALVITNIDVPFGNDLNDTTDVLGRAAPQYSRAWVFANRVAEMAGTGTVDRTVLLARTIAHEIGHLLLPTETHSERGIMKGSLALTEVGFFGFTPEQGAAMQARIRNESRARMAR